MIFNMFLLSLLSMYQVSTTWGCTMSQCLTSKIDVSVADFNFIFKKQLNEFHPGIRIEFPTIAETLQTDIKMCPVIHQ